MRRDAAARLWAPWRSAFVRNIRPRRCIFCAAKRSRQDQANHVIARGQRVFALLNRYPYNNGHLMIAPYRHVGDVMSLDAAEWLDVLRLTQRLMARIGRVMHPAGFNIGLNLGRIAGAGIPGHLHVHLVPRWKGDTNFMPVVGETKIVSQSLKELYALLVDRGGH